MVLPFLPHKSLSFFDYADSGATSEYYQYGAFIFPKFLSTFYAQVDDVRDSWVDSSLGTDSSWMVGRVLWYGDLSRHCFYLRKKMCIGIILTKNGIPTIWTIILNTTHKMICRLLNLSSYGVASWDGVDDDLMPEHLGVNYIELSAPEHSEMEVGIVGDEVGDQGTPVSWRLGLVRKSGGSDCIPRLGLWRTTGHRRDYVF